MTDGQTDRLGPTEGMMDGMTEWKITQSGAITKILMTNGSLMKVKSIAECSKGSILQYFRPALSDNWSWKPVSGLLESGFTVYE